MVKTNKPVKTSGLTYFTSLARRACAVMTLKRVTENTSWVFTASVYYWLMRVGKTSILSNEMKGFYTELVKRTVIFFFQNIWLNSSYTCFYSEINMYQVPNPGLPGCPPGLEYLTQVDQLLIKQKVEFIEALAGFESNNKYEVRNAMGQNVFYAVEENDCLSRQCCGPLRSFTIKVLDNFGQEVITVTRPLKCMSCFFPCCLQELEVQAPPGNTVGYVVQQWHPFSPKFIIENEHREAVLRLHGPFCGWSCLPDVDFEIVTMDEVDKIGKISKQWTGLLREAFTDADNFGIQFPMDLDVKMKAVMIGACFLIDFMFFESGNQP